MRFTWGSRPWWTRVLFSAFCATLVWLLLFVVPSFLQRCATPPTDGTVAAAWANDRTRTLRSPPTALVSALASVQTVRPEQAACDHAPQQHAPPPLPGTHHGWSTKETARDHSVPVLLRSAEPSILTTTRTVPYDPQQTVLHMTMWMGIFQLEGYSGDFGPDFPDMEQPGYNGTANFNKIKGQFKCPRRCVLDNIWTLAAMTPTRAIIFHGRDVDYTRLPPIGAATWVLMTLESPIMDENLYFRPELLRLFDYTMTYRRDSDFPYTYAPVGLAEIAKKPLAVPLKDKETDAVVAWVASNCDAFNNREVFIGKLMEQLPAGVHSFGKCKRNRAWPKYPHRGNVDVPLIELIARYRFYLAIENSDCHDYVTEKLFNSLRAGVVPIVNGPRTRYEPYLPVPDGAIFLDEYPSLKALVDHLQYLATNDTAYAHMLRYKDNVQPNQKPVELSPEFAKFAHDVDTRLPPFCSLCVRLHEAEERQHNCQSLSGPRIGSNNTCLDPIRGQQVRPDRSCTGNRNQFAHLEQ